MVLGGGSNLIDQWCTGYPIDQAEVTRSAASGGIGAGIGYGLGSLLGTAAKALSRTPVGQSVMGLFGKGSSTPAQTAEKIAQGMGVATPEAALPPRG